MLDTLIRFVTQRRNSDDSDSGLVDNLDDQLDYLAGDAEELKGKVGEALEYYRSLRSGDDDFSRDVIDDLEGSDDDLASSLRAIENLRSHTPAEGDDTQLVLDSIKAWNGIARNLLGSIYVDPQSDDDAD